MSINTPQIRIAARDWRVVRCLILFVSAATAIPSQAADIEVRRNMAYTEPADTSRRLDVYTTDEAKDWPIMVWIHGGGWKQGDKAGVQSKPVAFIDHKFVFVSINYRFIPDVTVQEMAGDVAKAIRWVHDHAAEIGGDPNKIYIAGHSAGAHLAALVAVDESYLKAEGMSLTDLKGCVPVDTAVYDIAAQLKGIPAIRARTYHPVFGDDPGIQEKLSPITHVAKGKGIPPFLILHVADRPDSTAQSNAFAKALKEAGVSASTFPAEGKNHGSINVDLGKADDKPSVALFDFLKSTLAN
jgi:arylformamidase